MTGLAIGLVNPLSAQNVPLSPPELITDRQGLPQSFIPAIVQDRQGFIWMATRDGLCRYDGQQFKVFQPQASGRPSLSFAGIRQLTIDGQGRLWILSEQGDLDQFDPRTEVFSNVSRLAVYRRLLQGNLITALLIDRQDRLWISLHRKGTWVPRGLVCLDTRRGRSRWWHFPTTSALSRERIQTIGQDKTGTIWLQSSQNLYRLDERRGAVHPDTELTQALSAHRERTINSLYAAPTGELLLGAQQGLFAFSPARQTLRYYPLRLDRAETWAHRFASDSRGTVYFSAGQHLYRYHQGQPPQPLDQYPTDPGRCLSLLVDRSEVLWFGTDGLGIRKYDLRANPFARTPYRHNFLTDLLSGWLTRAQAGQVTGPVINPYLFRYTLDQNGRLWVNGGRPTFYQLDPTLHRARRISLPGPAYNWEFPLATDPAGGVWTLVRGKQLWLYEDSRQQWTPTPYRLEGGRTGRVLQLVADEQAFWLATEGSGLFRLDRRNGQLRQYAHRPTDSTSLSSNALLCLSGDPGDTNRLWIGTFGSGLCVFDKRTGRSQRLTIENGLPNNVIYSALPDSRGYLWLGTNKGLCRLHRQTFQTRTYTRQDGLLADEFNRFHYLQWKGRGTAGEQLIMAGLEGFTAFYPHQLVDDHFEPPVELTRLYINNSPVDTRADSPLHGRPIQAVQHLDLPYDQNFVTIGFAAMQFNRPQANRYRYRLAGLESRWVQTPQPQAVYTDLRPGRYTLLVNAANTSGQWSRFVRRLTITIHPPLWATGWAYLLYALTAGLLIGYAILAYVKRLRLAQRAAWQQQEAQQLRLIDEIKSRFFANLTHEFRTPLTLILTPAQQLSSTLEDPVQLHWMGTIERNAQQLLRLINQLMDLSKLDAKAMPLHEGAGELSEFVGQCVEGFVGQAEAKGLRLRYESDVTGLYWFDADKLEQILTNLVSNALKFTPGVDSPGVDSPLDAPHGDAPPQEGQVVVQLVQGDESVTLVVFDTGIGIPAARLPFIFDRYYQVPTATSDNQAGSGIGLALVQELVSLQQGQISVQSQESSQTRSGETRSGWTRFTVQLPYRRASGVRSPAIAEAPLSSTQAPILAGDYTSDGEMPSILVVEDNPELAELIAQSLPQAYRISRAANGQAGLTLALETLPDLVISDVLMPIMDGYALCQTLKTDLRTSHIPLILLTAKSAHPSRMQGLALGADEYLTKPFRVPELQLRVRNLLQQRARVQAWVHQSLLTPQPSDTPQEPIDSFLAKVYDLLEAHLENPAYGVNELAADLAMSRPTLYRKCTSVANLAISELIQHYRLKRAGELLLEGYSSSETSYRVGFSTPTYFAKRFKDRYGVSPSEYAAQRAQQGQ